MVTTLYLFIFIVSLTKHTFKSCNPMGLGKVYSLVYFLLGERMTVCS